MQIIPFYTLKNKVADGLEDVSDIVAESARHFYCSVYNEAPGWVLRKNVLVSPLARQVLANACQPEGVPVLPPPPYEGGQCPVLYHVFGTYIGKNTTNCGVLSYWRTSVSLVGTEVKSWIPLELKDQNVVIALKNGTFGDVRPMNQQLWESRNMGDTPGLTITQLDPALPCINNSSRDYGFRFKVTQVLRVDGLPDNCGDPAPEPENIPPPNDSDITTNYNTTLVNGDRISYQIKINRDGDRYISFPAVINVGGVGVGIDIDGVNVGGININVKSGGGGGGGAQNEPPEEKPPEPEKPPVIVIEEKPGARKESGLVGLIGVKVSFSSIPKNAKLSDGNGTPRVIYGGWIEFEQAGFYYPRQYIDFDQSYYPAPGSANGYAVAIKRGYTANIFKIIRTEKEE